MAGQYRTKIFKKKIEQSLNKQNRILIREKYIMMNE